MTAERWLVTGALGCLGAWTVATLAQEGADVVAFDLGTDDRRLRLVASDDELGRVTSVRGDITDLPAVEAVLAEQAITHVVHLAALQVPFVKADPVRGAQVNVTGTVNVFEAAKRHGLRTSIAYASSAAVYDQHGDIAPRTLYGVYKLANEGTARVYWQDDGIASIGLRPFSVYGPGRDQGLTAGPTLAIEAAVRGEPYRIGFGGRTQLHYAPDVARAFVQAARSAPGGAAVYSLGGPATAIADFVARLRAEIPEAGVTFDETPLPFPDELPQPWFESPLTSLEQGIHETAELLRAAV
ncbi:MAG TPA: NAD(P)-dependent oxidoreductase [Gaiellaceae bacterium]|nr:NAD(P)-dependent oxidoreductase [Gaiellaceae bacterium]